MPIDRRSLMAAPLVLGLAGLAKAQTPVPQVPGGALPPGLPQPNETIDLWPSGAPGAPAKPLVETVQERSTDRLVTDRAVFGISRPRMAVFQPDRPNGAAVLITPGGGYRWVVVDKEGYEMGRWLAARGFTAFVLFYRLPGEGWAAGPDVALADAQRAMRLIRARARDFAIDPERVSAMGFSAGGHLCADLSTRFDAKVYDPGDAADRLSARPHSAAPIYPVVSMTAPDAHPGSRDLLLGKAPTPALEAAHAPHRNVPADAPPFFLLHAEDDEVVPVNNALLLRAALKDKGVRVETHLFEHGGHGFGLRKAIGKPVEVWPELWRAWARTTGLAL
ncbi:MULTISPECIES: alpha/beta hydrolase [Pseudomonadota]|jgi:acetyl esterase/lipase|uniref:alpha/beta hydrolase n=1 Tax=Pseudomonadota TaxID=1224 RepID=UPI000769CF4D|nr:MULTISPECIES: alpha/beta hydrolase [Pseudomonadota]MAF63553.1 alpha/beta hydrolase [Blastomonas sp.]MBA4781044.1 alpha/beta hydrolase [Blastomonas sp.]|tara:strand:+ start:58567 stop:59568 length:1002 start_codon:yes stop_codon:yes gene_type:complete